MTTRQRKPPELPPIDRFPSLEPGRSTKDYARDSQAPFKPLVTRPPVDELEEDDTDASLPPVRQPTPSRAPMLLVAALVVVGVLLAAGFFLL